MTRERMSEAGLLVAKPECQWRPGKGHPNRKCGVARNGICRQKAPWAWEAIVVGATVVEEVLVLEERPARVGGTERYDRGRLRSVHRVREGSQRRHGWRSGDRPSHEWDGDRGRGGLTQRRLRSSSRSETPATVIRRRRGRSVQLVAVARGREGRRGRGGKKGESLELES
jgi:hypothetical protein